MSLAFPLPLATFWDQLKIASVQWSLNRPRSVSETAAGERFSATRGTSLWRGVATLTPGYHRDAMAIEALLAVLDQGDASFLAYDPRAPSLALGGSGSATLSSISADRREISVIGFTGTFSPGDMIGIAYGSDPVRYGLHRVVTGATNGGAFEVVPPLRPAVTTGLAVTYTKPVCKCDLGPSPDYGSARALITAGASFEIFQTFR